MMGRNKAKVRCPQCGHKEIVTVLRLTTNNAIKKGLVTDIKNGWPLAFFKTTCRECHKSVTNRTFLCTDKRFNRYDNRMELLFYFDNLLVRDDLPYDLLNEMGAVAHFWKCKRCLRTWSENSGTKCYEICPRCGMKSLVRIIYGEPSDDCQEAAERNEVRLGGRIDDPDNPSWVCLECDYHI